MRVTGKSLLIGSAMILASFVASAAQASTIYEFYDDQGVQVGWALICDSGQGSNYWGVPTANYYSYTSGYC